MAKAKAGKSGVGLGDTVRPLRGAYEAARSLYYRQPVPIQHFFEAQGCRLAEAMLQNQSQTCFILPDRVITDAKDDGMASTTPVPGKFRDQKIGGVIARLTHSDICEILRHHLAVLELSPQKSVAVSAQLIRFVTAHFLIYHMLPTVRFVPYTLLEGEEIPFAPIVNSRNMPSAITGQPKAIAVTGASYPGCEAPPVSFIPAALQFFRPQWVTLDQERDPLGISSSAAEKSLALLQTYRMLLEKAVSIAPYFVFDGTYKQKRYCALRQLVSQGRAFARLQTEEIIRGIKQRAAAHELNRGLRLSLPFFDDQVLEIHLHDFTVIPFGRIMFVPAFVVRASREEQANVAQDIHLSQSTRKNLLQQLKMLENAFLSYEPTNSKA